LAIQNSAQARVAGESPRLAPHATHCREIRDVRSCDEVTGALNRTSFLKRLDEAILRDARLGKSLSFLLVDIEGFRAINAERGRLGGDDVLKSVSQAIQGATRGTDFVGRMGGDEFGVVLNECEDSRPAVNRLFVALQALNADSGGAPVHVSVGAVTIETPSNVEVPRPTSSSTTSERRVALARIEAVSRISTMKVLSPRATLSLAPTRERIRSTTPMRAAFAGTYAPICARIAISAFCRR
jgi:diguanylate cyclase (GGDEF)-like protein